MKKATRWAWIVALVAVGVVRELIREPESYPPGSAPALPDVGFDIAVINGALLLLRQQFKLDEIQTEFAASSLLFGCVAGAALGGWLCAGHGLPISSFAHSRARRAARLPRSGAP